MVICIFGISFVSFSALSVSFCLLVCFSISFCPYLFLSVLCCLFLSFSVRISQFLFLRLSSSFCRFLTLSIFFCLSVSVCYLYLFLPSFYPPLSIVSSSLSHLLASYLASASFALLLFALPSRLIRPLVYYSHKCLRYYWFLCENGETYPLADILWARWLNESKNNFYFVYIFGCNSFYCYLLSTPGTISKHLSIELESFVLSMTPLRFHLVAKEYNAMAPLCRFHIAIKTKLNWQAKTANHWFSFSSMKSIDYISMYFSYACNDSRIKQIGTRFKQFNS